MSEPIRVATPADAEQIAKIYAPIVRDTAISFELEPPSVEQVARRMTRTLRDYPWLVHDQDDRILGYAYAGPVRRRAAYRWSVEVSVYVTPNARSGGIGRGLGAAVMDICGRLGYVNAFGIVALPNPASVRLMEALGFVRVGMMRRAGYKLGEWHDIGWWQKQINRFEPDPSEPVPFSQLND